MVEIQRIPKYALELSEDEFVLIRELLAAVCSAGDWEDILAELLTGFKIASGYAARRDIVDTIIYLSGSPGGN